MGVTKHSGLPYNLTQANTLASFVWVTNSTLSLRAGRDKVLPIGLQVDKTNILAYFVWVTSCILSLMVWQNISYCLTTWHRQILWFLLYQWQFILCHWGHDKILHIALQLVTDKHSRLFCLSDKLYFVTDGVTNYSWLPYNLTQTNTLAYFVRVTSWILSLMVWQNISYCLTTWHRQTL
jgi:hypothetical protein